MAPEKREAFAAACGVDYKRARITIFILTSVALGFIGGFYAAQYRGVAYAIFDFQTVLLGLAMITIGGIGKAEGAVLGTLIVIFMRDVLIEWGPWRYVGIGDCHAAGRAVSQQRLFRHPQAVQRLARQEARRVALDAR